MNLYNCRVGDIVMTGDSYGMYLCLCIRASHPKEGYPYNLVDFLNLTDGSVHDSGSVSDAYLDDCYYVTRIEPEQVEEIKKRWDYVEV